MPIVRQKVKSITRKTTGALLTFWIALLSCPSYSQESNVKAPAQLGGRVSHDGLSFLQFHLAKDEKSYELLWSLNSAPPSDLPVARISIERFSSYKIVLLNAVFYLKNPDAWISIFDHLVSPQKSSESIIASKKQIDSIIDFFNRGRFKQNDCKLIYISFCQTTNLGFADGGSFPKPHWSSQLSLNFIPLSNPIQRAGIPTVGFKTSADEIEIGAFYGYDTGLRASVRPGSESKESTALTIVMETSTTPFHSVFGGGAGVIHGYRENNNIRVVAVISAPVLFPAMSLQIDEARKHAFGRARKQLETGGSGWPAVGFNISGAKTLVTNAQRLKVGAPPQLLLKGSVFFLNRSHMSSEDLKVFDPPISVASSVSDSSIELQYYPFTNLGIGLEYRLIKARYHIKEILESGDIQETKLQILSQMLGVKVVYAYLR